jgi:uncharacterized iron-regulated membrane protein
MKPLRWVRPCYLLHKWTSLACTLFLLVLCLTGLPLVFSDEIEEWLKPPRQAALSTAGADGGQFIPQLDAMVAKARTLHPGHVVRFLFMKDDDGEVIVVMAPADSPNRGLDHRVEFDARSATVLQDLPPEGKQPMTVMRALLRLHTELFAGFAGEMLLVGAGVVFLAALVSGALLYGPFMRKLDFGTVRPKSSRLKWLDLHNLLGICVLAWLLVVGLTGVLNELSKPLSATWRANGMNEMLRAYRGQPVPLQLGSAREAMATVREALPDRNVTSIIFPSTSFSNPHHYLVWTNGNTALTTRLFTAALVDAKTGGLTAVAQMPVWLRLLQVSRPLHFGDYGGLPLKIIWALLDLAAIAVLGSGLYLWFARRKATEARMEKLAQGPRT